MALVKSKLKQNLQNIFYKMREDSSKATDEYFSDEVAKACKSFGESGDIVTVDTGAVSSGSFIGSGSGSITLNSSLMASPILACCNLMKQGLGDDTTLANAIGNGVLAMTKAGQVDTDVVGVTTSPTGSPVPPSSGSAKGTISCNNSSLISGLIDCFRDMKNKYKDEGFDGDDYFADKLSSLMDSYFKSGSVSTSGTGVLMGTSGTGTMS